MDNSAWAGKAIVAGSTATSKTISRAVAAGELRAVALNLYTPDRATPLADFVRTHWTAVVSALAPDAVVSYRTAIEGAPASDGGVFLVGPSRYERRIPGLDITVVKGAGPQRGDRMLDGHIRVASPARALLDAARPTRKRGAVARGMTEEETEAVIRGLLLKGGEWAVEELREQMEVLSPMLGARSEFTKLSLLIDRILGKTPSARVLIGRAMDYVSSVRWADVPATRPFAEEGLEDAWSSYRLAGGTLPTPAARAVIEAASVSPGLEGESAILLGIHSVVGRRVPMARGVRDDDTTTEFNERIAEWFEHMTGSAPPPIASSAVLDLSHGTQLVREIEHPMARAFALHALVVAVRPFPVANGRIARACMSAELSSEGQARLVIPPEGRRAYASACRLYRNGGDVAVLADVCRRAHAAR